MALKADRSVEATDISFFYNAGTATRGGVAVLSSNTASGAAMDQGANLCAYATAASTDIPVGILLNDVVNKDLTRTHLNQHKDEVQKGGKVTIMTRGTVVTSNITGTPAPGKLAYADSSSAGNITVEPVAPANSGTLCVGRWASYKDSDGYAKLHVNLPQNHGA
tara:strand:- start:872 stop:1363 length:492 start_codon:yes stop_codon:yes gene_type:complete